MKKLKSFLTESKMSKSQAIKAAKDFVKQLENMVAEDEFDIAEGLIRDMTVCSDRTIAKMAENTLEEADILDDFVSIGELFEKTLKEISEL